MIYKAHNSFINELLSLPESGMGYQIIEAIRKGESVTEKFMVFNCDLIVELGSVLSNENCLEMGYKKMISRADYIDLETPTLLSRQEVGSQRVLTKSQMKERGRHVTGSASVDQFDTYASGNDIFVRLSFYENDRRVDFTNRRLIPGTYVTTYGDCQTCKAQDDNPVDRYSLPNLEEIEWVFHILPKFYDKYRSGFVEAANGCSGGGEEALFCHGTTFGTYFKKTSYKQDKESQTFRAFHR